MTLYTKMTINSQRYPLNLYLINNVEDILLYFRVWKCSSNLIISKCFHLASHFYRETTTEINQFSKLYTLIYIIHTWSDKAFKDTVVNRALSSLQFLENTLDKVWTKMLNQFVLKIYIFPFSQKYWKFLQ